MVEDYMQRNQDDFDDFAEPDDLYADLIEQLDNLEVSFQLSQYAISTMPRNQRKRKLSIGLNKA